MPVKIKMEVDKELMEVLNSLTDDMLTEVCDEEIENRILYLEALVVGWKKYRNVKNDHRRSLFLMLSSKNKDALQKYERLVLYPQVVKLEQELIRVLANAEEPSQPINASPKKLSIEEDLAADCPVFSLEENASSSTPEMIERCPTELFEPVLSEYDTDTSESEEPLHAPDTTEAHTTDDSICNPLTRKHDKMIDHALEVLEKSLLSKLGGDAAQSALSALFPVTTERYSKPRLEVLRNIIREMKESASARIDDYIRKQDDEVLARNIVHAAEQVKLAIDHVEEVQATTKTNPQAVSDSDLIKLETQLLHSVALLASTEVCLMVKRSEEAGKIAEPVSRGKKKRAKKAAKKAAEILEKEQKIVEEKENQLRQAKLALDALASLGMLPPPEMVTPVLPTAPVASVIPLTPSANDIIANVNKILAGNSALPLSNYEMGRYMEIRKSEKTYPEDSEEGRIVEKYLKHEKEIHDILVKQLKQEADNNEMIMQKVQEVAKTLPQNAFNLTGDEEIWRVVKNSLINKLDYWKDSPDSKASHYVQMYTHILANCTLPVAKRIYQFFPLETHPDAKLEETLLVLYQSGNFPGITDDIPT